MLVCLLAGCNLTSKALEGKAGPKAPLPATVFSPPHTASLARLCAVMQVCTPAGLSSLHTSQDQAMASQQKICTDA